MKSSRVLLCLLGISSLLFAKMVNNEQLQSLVNFHFPGKNIAKTEEVGKNLFLTHFEGRGFVLTAADDRMPAILAYSLNNVAKGSNPAFKEQCAYYDRQIETALPIFSNTHSDWDTSQWPSLSKTSQKASVEPLVSSQWDQAPHYNSEFPTFVLPGYAGQQALVGCVAVVMGQIINYYQHPPRGYGKRWYYSETTNTHMFANYDTSWYDYDNMPDSLCNEYGVLTVPLDQREEVSKLLLQCATAVEMDFQPGASSSAYEDMMYALKSHFDYGPSMELKEKSEYSDSEWNTILKAELDAGRPIPYRGQGDGGHAFILDGYKNEGGTKYHVNWGWGGTYDGWFTLSLLEATTGYNFSNHQAAVVDIEINPDNTTRYLHTGFEGLEAGWVYDGGGFYADQSGYDLAHNGELAYGFEGTDQWLISPKFQVPNHNNAILSIWAHMLNSGRQCQIYLSTTDTNRASFTNLLGTIAPSNSNWNEYYFSLRSYKNQNVYLGLYYNQSSGYITVDDVQVTRPKVITSNENIIPEKHDLLKAYPNPFNPTTTLSMEYGERSHSSINIFNLRGELVDNIFDGYIEAGRHEINWNASAFPTGIYICSLSINGKVKDTQKLLLVK